MIQVSIIGSGKVAQHLIQAFAKTTEIELVQVFSRKKDNVFHLLTSDKIITDLNQLIPVDIIIIAVSDDAIEAVSNQILLENQLVVHTSGSVSMEIVNNRNRKGVLLGSQKVQIK